MAAEKQSDSMQELRRVQSENIMLTEEVLHSSIRERATHLVNSLGLKWARLKDEPIPIKRRPFDCPKLSEALMSGRLEFEPAEFESFGAQGLRWDNCVQVGDLWFAPDVHTEVSGATKAGRRATGMIFTK